MIYPFSLSAMPVLRHLAIIYYIQETKLLFMNNALLARTGTILYALVIAVFGVTHLLNAKTMSGYVPGYFPAPTAMVYLTGICMLIAALAIIIGKKARLAGLLLALLLIIFVLTIHLPHLLGGDQSAMGMVLKDTAMAAGALLIAARSN
jgi:uncharacterized membrane protein